MLTNLSLKNFKGFDNSDISFRSLTLLAGLNSTGKSSVIHALLLLKQIGYQEDPSTDHFELYPNGDFISQGSGKDLLHEFASSDEITIGYTRDKKSYEWHFIANPDTHRLVTKRVFEREDLWPLDSLRFTYLSAERWGPRLTYPYEGTEKLKGVGIYGEYAIRYLIDHGEDPVENKSVHHPSAKGVGLFHQVQAWLGEVSPGVRLNVNSIREAGLSTVGFGFERRGDVASRYYRPTHVGFGLTYSLSVIVALLSSEPRDILLLENPEAHLHPKGQAQLAKLMALASLGSQIVVETHSDHIMNGIRVAVKQGDIPPERVRFNYFSREGVASKIDTPEIDCNGRLSFWPAGFFDEYERTLAALVYRPIERETK